MPTRKTHRIPPIASWPDWVFFLSFFLYTLIAGLLVQLVLLPYVFPSFHAGDGLMSGVDSRTFHWLAVHLAHDIDTHGWQVWTLLPSGQAVSGIAAIFYVLLKPHPWALLPWNSFLHALAAWTLYKTLRFFVKERMHALLGALPLLLFPSALTWAAQIHNDNYAVAGGVLVLYAWVCLARQESWQRARVIVGGVLALLIGAGMTWLVRDYLLGVFTGIGALLTAGILVIHLIRWIRSQWTWKQTLLASLVVCLAFASLAMWQTIKLGSKGVKPTTVDLAESYSPTETPPTEALPAAAETEPAPAGEDGEVTPEAEEVVTVKPEKPSTLNWEKTAWLPDWVDYQMKQLSITRAKAIREWTDPKGRVKGSNIDTDVIFHSAQEIVGYLPRALQIGLLSPFPAEWFGSGSKAPNTMMRRASAVEMSFVYLCWIGLLYALWIWRKRPELWVGLAFCLGMLFIYVLGTPNVGTLYRLRYAYIMPLVGIGVAGWINLIQHLAARLKQRRERPASGG